MRFWIARDKYGNLSLHICKPIYRMDKYDKTDYWTEGRISELPTSLFPEVTFENNPQKVELKLINDKPLTRDYFANHNWNIINYEPDENGFILWEATWKRRMEDGSPYYSDLSVTNMVYEDRFCISGRTSEGNVDFLMAYTEEDLINILKVLDIYDYYKKEAELKLT